VNPFSILNVSRILQAIEIGRNFFWAEFLPHTCNNACLRQARVLGKWGIGLLGESRTFLDNQEIRRRRKCSYS
jgi:hypothetical protein